MGSFNPDLPFNVPFYLLTPSYQTVKGVRKKVFEKSEKPYFCSFRTFGGTEKTVNDVLVVEDTATLETWFTPEIKAGCEIEVDGVEYEILGTPENINKRNQYLVFKVRAVKGGA